MWRRETVFRRRRPSGRVRGPIDKTSFVSQHQSNRRLPSMRLHMNAADVRGLVARHFIELGADADEVADVQENIRIDRGRCVARCYRVAEIFAMWLIDVGVLQFYDADGEMLHTVNLFTERLPHRAAA
jgi:hypothetical protein